MNHNEDNLAKPMALSNINTNDRDDHQMSGSERSLLKAVFLNCTPPEESYENEHNAHLLTWGCFR